MTPERWRQITELFHAARELGPAGRDAFLADACRADAGLRHEVDAMLGGHDGAGAFGEVPLVAPASGLELGFLLGSYRVGHLLGAGGMGEVYRARDTKLNRDVALKVLPDSFANDPGRLARFTREAQTLAALNHPNIAHIYGFEESGGVRALVMELVEGEDLAQRLGRGPIPLDEALPIAKQIAEALDTAHKKGIVHRDLKPANIKTAPDGVVKVLDFGLAKVLAGEATGFAPSQSPTMTLGATTREGVVLGTAAYMSPEQARGQVVDKRTDLWAFGCVLYEMLTGRRAFGGDTTPETIVAMLEREPDWGRLPAATPPSVRRLLRRCLEKDRTQRLPDIGDARAEIEGVLNARRPLRRGASFSAALIAVVAVAAAIWFYVTRPATLVTSPSEYVQLTDVIDAAMAPSLSPDGRLVTYKRGSDSFLGAGDIYVKVLPDGQAVRLTSDQRPKYGSVFTPDASRIAYTALTGEGPSLSWDTWTVPVLGGPPTRLLPNASGLTWLPKHRVLFSEITSGLHMQVVTATESRAESRVVYSPALDIGMAHYSYPSPDLQSVLVVEMGNTHTFDSPCRLVPLDGRSAGQPVGPAGMCYSAAWSPDGSWMYFAANVGGHAHLWRQRFPNGTPEQITFGTTEEEGIAVASDGRSLITSVGHRVSAIWLHDPGGEHPITFEGYASNARWSADGTQVFYLDSGTSTVSNPIGQAPAGELRVIDVRSGKTDTVLPGMSVTDYDVSRDGRDVVFTTLEHGESQLWLGPLNRSASPRQLARSADQVSFGGDGDVIFRASANKTNFLDRMNVDGSRRERIVSTPIIEKGGVSPDGAWVIAVVALAKDDKRLSDPLAVPYDTMAIPTPGGPMRKLCNGACHMRWSVDGRFLYVQRGASGTLVLSIPVGSSLPDLPASGISVGDVPNELPNARIIAQNGASFGSDPSTYLFTRVEHRANLFQIRLH